MVETTEDATDKLRDEIDKELQNKIARSKKKSKYRDIHEVESLVNSRG